MKSTTTPAAADMLGASSLQLFGSNVWYWTYHPEKTATIVMIHGFRGTHHGLLDIIDRLPEYRVIIPDLPGFGDSAPMTDRPNNMTGYTDLVEQLITRLELGPVIILGHSMGTIVGAELAARSPQLVSHLILVNPIAEHPLRGVGALKMAPGVWYHWLGGKALPDKLGHKLLRNRFLFLVGSETMTKTKDPALRAKIHASHITYMSKFHDRATLLEVYRASINGTATEWAGRITCPTLLVAGKIDAIAPIKGQRLLAAAIPGSTLVELDNVGHIIHFEKPAEAAAAILKFLN